MNAFILLFGLIVLLLNIVFGNVLEVYPIFNMGINCAVIAFTTLLLYALQFATMAMAFRISIFGLFSFLGLAMLVLGILSPDGWKYNGFVIAIFVIMAFEAVVLAVCNLVSRLNINNEVKNGK
jgi:hypothetical protein